MPTYQYECSGCGNTLEILQSMTEKKLKKCPQCGENKLQRLIGSGSGVIFKGKGFYETDYKRKSLGSSSSDKGSDPCQCCQAGQSGACDQKKSIKT
jgi:putative FmdB family regulatory protein